MKSLLTPPFRTEIITDLSWAEYLETEGMNPSRLVHGLKSMKHLKSKFDPRDEKPQRALLVGAMTHALIFEKPQFNDRFACYDGIRRGKKYEECVAENEGKDIFKPDEFEQAKAVAKAVMNYAPARDIIEESTHEVSVSCEFNGIQCKGRLDALSNIITDLKTTTNVEDHAFGRVSSNLNYRHKMACYRKFVELVIGHELPVKVIAVETKEPFDVVIIPLPAIGLRNAWDELVAKVFQRVPGCIESDTWPGVADGEERPLVVPDWAMRDDPLVEYQG